MSFSVEMHRGVPKTFAIEVKEDGVIRDMSEHTNVLYIASTLGAAANYEIEADDFDSGDTNPTFTIDQVTADELTADKYFLLHKAYQASDMSDLEAIEWGLLYVLGTINEVESS